VLWDKKLKTIVNNESSEIIRMLNTEFDGLLSEESRGVNLVPQELGEKIDETNAWIYVSRRLGTLKTARCVMDCMLTEGRTILITAFSK
jgi:putative glutathione S-transferase